MRLDRRSVRNQLERMGQAHVPPPSADFVVRTEERLRLSRLVTIVDDDPVATPARRRTPWVTALAAAAAAALLLAVPNDENRQVTLTTDRAATSTTPAIAASTTTLAPTTTTSSPPPQPALPPVAVTTATTAAPVTKVRPTTTTTAAIPTPTTTVADRPATTTTTTAALAPAPVRIELRCVPGSDGDLPSITCIWTAPDDSSIAAWKLHRAVGTDAKRLVWTTTDVSARRYVDHDVVTGTTYHYAVEGVTAAGRTVAKGGIVDVACCL